MDWLSTGSPATTKNGLTVGASRSARTVGGYATDTWGKRWGTRFPNKPICDETISGDPECMAGFSSRGPCDDRRVKPDVVAPGTDILSAKSSTAPAANYWGVHATAAGYAYNGGTSMAAPLVAGCAAAIRDYYTSVRQIEPSAAVLKATLINSTRWLTGADAVADHAKIPNYHQGFGLIHMPYAVPNPAEPWLKLGYLDTWNTQDKARKNGDLFRYDVEVDAGGAFLRFCLAYTDAPFRALRNI